MTNIRNTLRKFQLWLSADKLKRGGGTAWTWQAKEVVPLSSSLKQPSHRDGTSKGLGHIIHFWYIDHLPSCLNNALQAFGAAEQGQQSTEAKQFSKKWADSKLISCDSIFAYDYVWFNQAGQTNQLGYHFYSNISAVKWSSSSPTSTVRKLKSWRRRWGKVYY